MGEFAEYLSNRIQELDLQFSEVAKKTKERDPGSKGISAVYVARSAKGERVPEDEIVILLCKALDLPVEEGIFKAHKDKAPEEIKELFDFQRVKKTRDDTPINKEFAVLFELYKDLSPQGKKSFKEYLQFLKQKPETE